MKTKFKYEYNPKDFRNMLGISEDLTEFYRLLEVYRESKNDSDWFTLRRQWELLHFDIKAKEAVGIIHPCVAQEMKTYLEVLTNDRF